MHRRYCSIFLACCALILGIPAANVAKADVYQSTTGLTDPSQLLTFDEVVLPVQTPLTNQYAAYGVTFSGAIYDPYAPPGNNGPNISGNAFSNFIPHGTNVGPLLISFASPVEAAAMSLISQTGTTTITSYLGATPVETYGFSTNLTSTDNYIGFINSDFDSLKITVSSSDQALIADNLQFVSAGVPEASTLVIGLLSLSLPGAGLLLRKRRKESGTSLSSGV